MILQFIESGTIDVPMVVALLFILLFGMGLHEYGHAIVATWWGDPTPRENGRLTINPFVHIYWPGFLMFLFIGFGILGSVQINANRMRDPRWGSFWASFGGPLMNLLLAIGSAIIYRLIAGPLIDPLVQTATPAGLDVLNFLLRALGLSVWVNCLIFVVSLVPCSPLDGWHMVLALLPGYFMKRNEVPQAIRHNAPPISEFLQRPAYKWQAWAQWTQVILFAMLAIGFVTRGRIDPLTMLISQPANNIATILMGR